MTGGVYGTIASAAPAIGMLGVFACVIGGVQLIRTRRDLRKGMLMLAVALVLLGNVLIWTL